MVLHNWLLRYNCNTNAREAARHKPTFTQSALKPCLYHLRGPNQEQHVDICVFVDDIMATFPNTETGRRTYSDFIEAFKQDYKLQDDGYTDCTDFTGINLTWSDNRTTPWIDQPKIVQNILKKYGAWNSRAKFTPALIKQLV